MYTPLGLVVMSVVEGTGLHDDKLISSLVTGPKCQSFLIIARIARAASSNSSGSDFIVTHVSLVILHSVLCWPLLPHKKQGACVCVVLTKLGRKDDDLR